ncbi:hypothetical protein OAR18_03210 [Candidatus Pseudothioglobus singularis]|nr:hypothetical protein [Candidatus Pseudothioglobus singularis]
MKKLLLLLSIPLNLIGCSKDRNYDGEITITDSRIAAQDFFIPFGEFSQNAFNAFSVSNVGKFLEIGSLSLDRAGLTAVGIWTILFTFFLLYIIGRLWANSNEKQREIIREARREAHFKKVMKDINKKSED